MFSWNAVKPLTVPLVPWASARAARSRGRWTRRWWWTRIGRGRRGTGGERRGSTIKGVGMGVGRVEKRNEGNGLGSSGMRMISKRDLVDLFTSVWEFLYAIDKCFHLYLHKSVYTYKKYVCSQICQIMWVSMHAHECTNGLAIPYPRIYVCMHIYTWTHLNVQTCICACMWDDVLSVYVCVCASMCRSPPRSLPSRVCTSFVFCGMNK